MPPMGCLHGVPKASFILGADTVSVNDLYSRIHARNAEVAESVMDVDVLSDALAMVRLSGALVFRVDIRGPWGIAGDPTFDKFAAVLPPGTNHIITFHVVLHGECWVRHASRGWFCVPRGHAVVLAHGDRHDLADCRGRPTLPFATMLGGRPLLELRHERFDTGTAPVTGLLCGFLGCDRRAFAPLCAALPALLTVALDEQANT